MNFLKKLFKINQFFFFLARVKLEKLPPLRKNCALFVWGTLEGIQEVFTQEITLS